MLVSGRFHAIFGRFPWLNHSWTEVGWGRLIVRKGTLGRCWVIHRGVTLKSSKTNMISIQGLDSKTSCIVRSKTDLLLFCRSAFIYQYVTSTIAQVTLPKTNIAMENPPFWWYLQGNMGVFMGYVSFREGIELNLKNPPPPTKKRYYFTTSSF